MTDKRRIKIPVFPYILFILAIVTFLASGMIYLNYPSQTNILYGTLIASAVIMLIAFILRPAMFKELVASRKTLLWVNDFVLILIIISIGIVLAHIGFRRNIRYDFTKTKMYSLSDMTVNTVRKLEKDVKITGFFPKGTFQEEIIKDLLSEYRRNNDRLSFTLIDPTRDPVTAKAMNIGTMFTVVIQCDSSRRDLFMEDLFNIPNRYDPPDSKPEFIGEQAITSAIINVTSGIKRMISFVKGHDEASISGYQHRDISGLNELLIHENFDTSEASLLDGNIDERVSLLAIISPQKDYIDTEIEKIKSFLRTKEGHLLIAIDPGQSYPNLEKLISDNYGIFYNDDVVVDPRGVQRNYWTVAPVMADHAITAPIKAKNMLALMFHCRSMSVENKPGIKSEAILKTIENSWAKREFNNQGSVDIAFDQSKDVRGPLNIGFSVEKTITASDSRAIILGDSDFFSNGYIAALSNRDLIINSINWLVGQHDMITIRPRILEMPTIVINEADANRIFTLCVVVVPLLIILFGGIVYMIRRRV